MCGKSGIQTIGDPGTHESGSSKSHNRAATARKGLFYTLPCLTWRLQGVEAGVVTRRVGDPEVAQPNTEKEPERKVTVFSDRFMQTRCECTLPDPISENRDVGSEGMRTVGVRGVGSPESRESENGGPKMKVQTLSYPRVICANYAG